MASDKGELLLSAMYNDLDAVKDVESKLGKESLSYFKDYIQFATTLEMFKYMENKIKQKSNMDLLEHDDVGRKKTDLLTQTIESGDVQYIKYIKKYYNDPITYHSQLYRNVMFAKNLQTLEYILEYQGPHNIECQELEEINKYLIHQLLLNYYGSEDELLKMIAYLRLFDWNTKEVTETIILKKYTKVLKYLLILGLRINYHTALRILFPNGNIHNKRLDQQTCDILNILYRRDIQLMRL